MALMRSHGARTASNFCPLSLRRVAAAPSSGRRALSTVSDFKGRVSVARGADGVVQVALTRPEKMNALDMDMFRAIQGAAKSLIADSAGVRAVVVHGQGRSFCAGLDVKSVSGNPFTYRSNIEELMGRPEGEISNLAQDVAYLWRRVPAPVIAATQGVCLGGATASRPSHSW